MQTQGIVIAIAGRELSFKVAIIDDQDHGAPWVECDGHGPVSGWTRQDKRPGELLLNDSHGDKRYYDYAEACRIALRDGWGISEQRLADWTESAGRAPTKRQIAAAAARADFEYLRGWCNDEWRYVGVVVTLLNPDGTESDISESLWGVEDSDIDYVRETARNLADEIAGGLGVSWGLQTREVYAMGEVETDDC